jgi:flagellar hook assembly protein FlgD
VKGQKIKTLVNRNESSGYHSVIWDGSDESGQQVASGLYLYKLRTIKMVKTKKMMLLD